MFKKVLCLILSATILLSLCGCDLFASDAAELLSPPTLSGELAPIAEAINKSAGDNYNFQYPSRGDYRSAVVQFDIDSDGILEAFAFYSMAEGETTAMHINALTGSDGEWSSAATQKIIAGGVDRVDFCDLDGDGVYEILVGWEIYGTTEMQLAVYSMGKNALTQRMLQKYSKFITCDLDEDKKNEILLIKSDPNEGINSASLFEFNQDGVTEIASCELDSAAKTINDPVIATLSTGKPAVYIDIIKGIGAVTEVLFMEKGRLANPLFQEEARETVATLRSVLFKITDINDDGIVEIPVQENVPSVARKEISEKLYLTHWCSFNGEALTRQMTAMMNNEDGYYFVIPAKLVGKIAVFKDTDNNIREVFSYNPEDSTVGESLFYIKAVSKADWDAGSYNADGIFEIVNDGVTSFICKLTPAGKKAGFSVEKIKADFKLYTAGIY